MQQAQNLSPDTKKERTPCRTSRIRIGVTFAWPKSRKQWCRDRRPSFSTVLSVVCDTQRPVEHLHFHAVFPRLFGLASRLLGPNPGSSVPGIDDLHFFAICPSFATRSGYSTTFIFMKLSSSYSDWHHLCLAQIPRAASQR